ncbi:MC-2TM Maurer's cleft two transmembrane protein, putative [Plasmodium sp. gorilla clade G3]|nr:MC-2TM Maurer's cleft two transmembrane protein, putative [Plasmodium sp. gorilla clade G3]
MFHQIYIFIIILSTTNLFNKNRVEIGTYRIAYHNGMIQFRMLEQINTNTKPYGNTLTKVFLNVKNEKGNKAKDNKTKTNKPKENKTNHNKLKDNKPKNNKPKDNKTKDSKKKDNKIKDNITNLSITKRIKTKLSKSKTPDPQILSLVNTVDSMNITQEKKDTIKNFTLKYINSDDIKEKNKSINELEKYRNDEECKEHMDNYLMYVRMQKNIKYLKRDNFWNKIGIIAITLLLIIVMIVFLSSGATDGSVGFFYLGISFLMIYLFARFFPKSKFPFIELKENYTYFSKKKIK